MWLLAGDFNELMSNEEKLGGAIRDESTFWDFRNVAENCKIKELRFVSNSLSWEERRDNVWVRCRLYRSFGNDEWFTLFPRESAEYLDMWASDHQPLRTSFTWKGFIHLEEGSSLIIGCSQRRVWKKS